MKDLKICVLSMQRVQNFGSLLQGYALKKLLEQLGHTVSFLDIERNEADDQLLGERKHDYSSEIDFSTRFLTKLKKLDKYTLNRLRIKVLSKLQNRNNKLFREGALGMDDTANEHHYDCCVIGSDEVFNCMTGAPWGFTGQLFGDVQQADRVITYAASCGATVPEELPEAVSNRIREAFRKVSAFSVRDKNTLRLVSGLTDSAVQEHLDPVLVGDFEEELERTKLPDGLPERYCVVYSYYNRIHRREEMEGIQAFCRKHRMEIVTVGAPQMWAKNYLVMDPFEVLRVFQNAAFVVTDTFHGTIFSVKYAQRFATMTRASNKNKLADLIERLGIQAHQVTSFAQLEEAYAHENDNGRIAALCAAERERTICYLMDSL